MLFLASSEEETALALLPSIEDMIHELECMESAQIVRDDVTLPADVNAVSRVMQQQQVPPDSEILNFNHCLSIMSFLEHERSVFKRPNATVWSHFVSKSPSYRSKGL